MENILPIIQKEADKLKKVLKILNFSEDSANEEYKKLIDLITLNVSLDLLSKKGYKSESGEVDAKEIEEFIKDNYTPEEIKVAIEESVNKTTKNYFSTLLKDVPAEKIEEIEKIIEER